MSAGNLLKIPELGIEMTLPAGLSDSNVVYSADSTQHVYQDANNKDYHYLGLVSLTTKSLTSKESGCGIQNGGAAKGPTGVISFDKTQEDLSSGYSIASPSTNYEKVGTFYMAIVDRQTYCSGGAGDALESTAYDLFKQAYTTIKPIQ